MNNFLSAWMACVCHLPSWKRLWTATQFIPLPPKINPARELCYVFLLLFWIPRKGDLAATFGSAFQQLIDLNWNILTVVLPLFLKIQFQPFLLASSSCLLPSFFQILRSTEGNIAHKLLFVFLSWMCRDASLHSSVEVGMLSFRDTWCFWSENVI